MRWETEAVADDRPAGAIGRRTSTAGRDARLPADAWLRRASALVALIGLGIAAYLTLVHYTGAAPACAIAHGCEVVQSSSYAKLAGIPVALLGLLGYVGILVTLLRDDETARMATALLALGGAGFSAGLTYVEIARLDAICIWCVGSAICMVLLAGLSVARVLSAPSDRPA
jgi:uncharacterized membrane protein